MLKRILMAAGVLLVTTQLHAQADLKTFTALFDQRNAAVKAGNLDDTFKLLAAHVQKELNEEAKTTAEKKQILDFWKMMIPDPYTAGSVQVSPDGKKAILFISGDVTNDKGKKEGVEQTVNFAQEGGQWKIDFITFGGPPAKIKKSKDETFEPATQYDAGKSTNIGGRILKTDFQATYTVVTLRMLDEEDLIYLPAKTELEKKGIKAADLEAGKAYSFDAHPHKSNPLKYWGVGGQPVSYFNNN